MASKRIVLVLTVMLLLAGCAGFGVGDQAASGGDQSAESGGQAEQQLDSAVSQSGAGAGSSGASQPQVQAEDRAIVRTGRMVVEVENFSTARETVTARVESYGGYVEGSNQQLRRDGRREWRTGYVVLRVPRENFDDLQDDVRETGTVVNEDTETEDVSDQLVDIEARLENLRGRRDRLRTFYQQADDTQELLAIEEELSQVQGEIERLEAQKRSLEQQVAYSTLRVELREDAPGPDQINTAYHEQSLVSAFLGSIQTMYVAVRTLLVVLVTLAPWLAVLGLGTVGVRRGLRRTSLPYVGGREGDDGAS